VTLRVRLGFLSRVQVSHGGIDGNDLLAQQRKMKMNWGQLENPCHLCLRLSDVAVQLPMVAASLVKES